MRPLLFGFGAFWVCYALVRALHGDTTTLVVAR